MDRYKPPDICPYSNKITYRTKKRAQKYADKFAHRYNKRQWVYRCRKCGYWHLTSLPQEKFKEGE